MQNVYDDFVNSILDLFLPLSDFSRSIGLPLGRIAWLMISVITPLVVIIAVQFVRGRRAGGASANVTEGIQKIIASIGDVSAGMAGAKKLKFIKTPSDALVFLKIEENAIQQALSATDYYAQQGEIDGSMKEKISGAYQIRLDSVRAAMAKDEQLKEIVDTDTAIDKARSDYLRKMAAMTGTEVEDDSDAAGPTSVGMPSATPTPIGTAPDAGTQAAGPPGGAAPSGLPSGGPPGGGPPGGGPPGGGAPSGGPPGGGPPGGTAPSGGPPGGAAPGGPPGGSAPGGGPPGGAVPSGGPPGAGVPSGPPGGDVPSGAPAPGGKSSLQSEMLAEMERLKALMSGD